ncbi:hypothetical protein L915_20371 [Phytophthora nicotianae]|uniref:Uncharacterized protein n=1 Tax=Phytophthora nicotianae TaxID=4792 RepID=W2FP14_PHYNI|nr:hypothetical protein L915_20371 [Phytophthora nicotianae]
MGDGLTAAQFQSRASGVATPQASGSLFEEVTFKDMTAGDEETKMIPHR